MKYAKIKTLNSLEMYFKENRKHENIIFTPRYYAA